MRPPADTSLDAHLAQLEVLRRMGPGRRLLAGFELTAWTRRLVAEGIRMRHPDYDEESLRLAEYRLWLGPELYGRAYPGAPELAP
ncbi:MAG: hypothetical protein HY722_14045 [Planctomycetes bacterium]|nr:hypothetical protein [Planctomycetota bacterium]